MGTNRVCSGDCDDDSTSSFQPNDTNPEEEFVELGLEGLDEPARRFSIRDESGQLRATLVRTLNKEFWFEGPDGSPGLKGTKPADLPLFGSERLRRVPLGVPVVVTEGPKDCEAVWRAGRPAVGTVTGAGDIPSAASLEVLRDRSVVLWPDNDEAGYLHMERVAEALAGIAREIRWLQVPGLPPKGGAADVSVEDIARLVDTLARVMRTRVSSSDAPWNESGESLSPSRESPTYARAHAQEVGRQRYSHGELAEMRKSVERRFLAPSPSALRELVRVLDHIQGRFPGHGQIGYLISCYQVHGPATADLLLALYRERGFLDNLLLALELAPPAWLQKAGAGPSVSDAGGRGSELGSSEPADPASSAHPPADSHDHDSDRDSTL